MLNDRNIALTNCLFTLKLFFKLAYVNLKLKYPYWRQDTLVLKTELALIAVLLDFILYSIPMN